MRVSAALTVLWLLATFGVPAKVLASASIARSSACSASLTLYLRPGPIPGGDRNGPPARDIPPNPVAVLLPLYPAAISSTLPIPDSTFQVMPPAYRKVAGAEFAVSARYDGVSSWYRTSLAACGFWLSGKAPLQQHGGPRYAGLFFTSRDGLRWLTLTFRPVSPRLALVRYLVQELDLPPRPVASFLRGSFMRVSVLYQSVGALPSMNHVYRFMITWPATITRLVRAVNRPTRIAVSGLGSGGLVIMTERSALSFVRTDGGTRRVKAGGVFNEVVVGHTRPLEDIGVQRLVDRIVTHRCQSKRACM